VKIVIIGAGSHSFGRGQIADLLQAEQLQGKDVRLALVDVDEQALNLMARLAERIKHHTGSDMVLESTTDRAAALPGADYVITAVARKRMELWEQDFRVPLSHGFRHPLGENGGPGAIFHALRSFELILPVCRDMERLCPQALLLNFTNPEARVLHAICHLTKVRAAGICHGVFGAVDLIARYLKRPPEDLEVISAGINHFFTVLSVKERASGKQWLPELLHMAATDTSGDVPPLFSKMAEIFGVFTYPSDDHIGEYLAYGAEFTGLKWPYGQESRPVPVKKQRKPADLEAYATGKRPVDEDVLRPSGEVTVPIITDIELDTGSFRPAVNVLNTGPYISNLPADAVVEVPATVDRAGLHPLSVGPLPEAFAAAIRTQCAINSLVTEAYRTRSKKLLLQALLLDPVVNSMRAASSLLDEMLELQSDFLPSFA
jgi:alpha-galactosidase